MNRHLAWALFAALVPAATAACGNGPPDSSSILSATETANDAARAWQAKHEVDYRRDWVTIAALHSLKPGSNAAGSAATNDIVLPSSVPPVVGRFALDGERVRFEPAPGVRVLFEKSAGDRPNRCARRLGA